MASRNGLIGVIAAAIDADVRIAALRAREAGFEGLAFDAFAPGIDLTQLSASGRREFRNVLAAQNLDLISLNLELDPAGFALGADVDRSLARIRLAMEAAAGLRAPLLTLDLGRLPRIEPAILPPKPINPDLVGLIIIPESKLVDVAQAPAQPPDPGFVSQVQAALDIVGRDADRFGVVVAMRSALSSYISLNTAIRSVTCSWFGVDLDPVAMLKDHWDPDQIFSAIGGLIRHVRVRDAVIGDGSRSVPAPVGRGQVEWAELLAALDESNYPGPLTVDSTGLQNMSAAAALALSSLRALKRN
jgi:sugar phosphate isomerase/epimerase